MDPQTETHTGGCLCGAVRFEVSSKVEFSCLCHCPSCRKAAGAPVVGWVMFEAGAFRCDRSNVTEFASSEGARRSFCNTCGTTLFYEADYIPGLIDITLESLTRLSSSNRQLKYGPSTKPIVFRPSARCRALRNCRPNSRI